MRETWTLAVFSAMNSCAPISRLVEPLRDQAQDFKLPRREAEGVLECLLARARTICSRAQVTSARVAPGAKQQPRARSEAVISLTSQLAPIARALARAGASA